MADEPIKPNPPVDTAALMAEVEALRKSNREILDDYKKAKEAAKAVPPDVDVDALIAFKQQKERKSLRQKADMMRRLLNRHSSIVMLKRLRIKESKS